MADHELDKPIRMYKKDDGRVVILTHSYEAEDNSPHGYYYHYEDKPATRHWISSGAVPVRFTLEPPALKAVSERRKRTIAAAMAGVANTDLLGVVSVFETDKGFRVQYDNDEQMDFNAVEF
jgi:hypothetical protein